MKHLSLLLALLLVVSVRIAWADPVVHLKVTQGQVLIGQNSGEGDNVSFTLIGPGFKITGFGGIPCNGWCTTEPLFPGTSVFPFVDEIFLEQALTLTLNGQTYEDIEFGTLVVNVGRGFILPTNFNGTTFTVSVPASFSPTITGHAGHDPGLIFFDAAMPSHGKLVATYTYHPATSDFPAYFVYSHGVFMVTPEPGTLVLVGSGLAALVAARRKSRRAGGGPAPSGSI